MRYWLYCLIVMVLMLCMAGWMTPDEGCLGSFAGCR